MNWYPIIWIVAVVALFQSTAQRMTAATMPKRTPVHKTETALNFEEEIKFIDALDAHAERKCDPKTCIWCMKEKDGKPKSS